MCETLNKQRTDNLSWDEYFMAIARLSAMRSKDPNTQVGACIVSGDNRILSIGYNGTPNGFRDDCFPWDREGEILDTKYIYVVHAERNAIFNMITNGEQGIDKVLCILPDGSCGAPCGACRELMVQLMAGKYYDIEIMLDYSACRIVKLGEITPEWWIK